MDMSSTTSSTTQDFTDYGSNLQLGQPTTHHLTLYRAPSGALVFGAGTVQWSWGLDNGAGTGNTDTAMQQATVNLFADMGAQPFITDLRADPCHRIDRYDRAHLSDHITVSRCHPDERFGRDYQWDRD